MPKPIEADLILTQMIYKLFGIKSVAVLRKNAEIAHNWCGWIIR
jgi:hypothetical protein